MMEGALPLSPLYMPRVIKSNIPTELLRWSLTRASEEFGQAIGTIRAGLAKNAAVAGQDGCYSTQQICDALYGALHLEKIRTQRATTERITLENQITRTEVLNRAELMKVFSAVADEMVYRIQASGLSPEEKSDLQRSLASVPVGIDGVAKRQSRFRGAKNGQAEDDESES